MSQERTNCQPNPNLITIPRFPKRAEAADCSPCRLLVVVASRDYLLHGDISKLLQMPCK